MSYLFLPEDYEQMNRRITEIIARMRHFGQEMGLACQEGAETFHDNFAYEDGERQHRMWGERLRALVRVRNEAQVVRPPETGSVVGLGRRVTVRDLGTGEIRCFRIGSYMVFGDGDEVSYQAPWAAVLLGATVGEVREWEERGVIRELEVLEVA